MSVSIAQPFAEDIAIVAGSAFRGERCFLLQTDERAIVLSKTGAINSSHLRASAPAAKRPLVRHVINFVVTSRGTWQLVKCSRHVVWVGGVLCGFVTSQCSLRSCGFLDEVVKCTYTNVASRYNVVSALSQCLLSLNTVLHPLTPHECCITSACIFLGTGFYLVPKLVLTSFIVFDDAGNVQRL